MTTTPQAALLKFTKKPVTIEAAQWFKHGDHHAVVAIPADHPIDRNCIDPSTFGWVPTLEGGHVVTPGDWIIQGVKGEFYPCKPDIFAATYEPAKLQATQEPVQSVPDAMKVVTEALRSDPDYAWSWHCNVAMASVDEGMNYYKANQAAARFMYTLAGVDTTKHQCFPEEPKQEPVRAGELPPVVAYRVDYPPAAGVGLPRFFGADDKLRMDNLIGATGGTPVELCDRAALSARKPAVPMTPEQWAETFLTFMAEPNWSAGDYYVQGIKDAEKHHGIGLEVKP